MAGTTVRASSIGTATTGTAQSVAAPTGTTTGDLVIVVAHMNVGGGGTISDNNGATPFTQDLVNLAGSSQCVTIFSRRIQVGDPSTYNFTGNTSDRWTNVAVCFQNPDPSTIYDVAPSSGHSTIDPSTDPGSSAPSIITLNGNSIFCAVGLPDGASTTSSSTPAGFTVERNAGNQCVTFTDKLIASPGATGIAAFSWNNSNPSVCCSFAIKNSVTSNATPPWPLLNLKQNTLMRM